MLQRHVRFISNRILLNILISMASQVSFKFSPQNGLSSEKGGSSTQGEREEVSGPTRIEGYVNLKRKNDWVKRYAVVDNCIFTYKKA